MAEDPQAGHGVEDTASAKAEPHSRTWVKRPLVWIGTLATAVVSAVAITLVTHFTSNVVSGGDNSQVPSGSSQVSYRPYVAVRHEAGFSAGCGSWIVAKPPQDVTPPPSSYDSGQWDKWIAQNKAIDATPWPTSNTTGATNLDVTIQGRTATPVILTGIQFIALHRKPGTIQGGVITNACGGPIEARYMEVNLDDNPIKIVASHRDPFPPPPGERWLAKPVRFPYYVTDTNGEVFKIIAYGHSDVVWYAKLFWSVDGKNGESVIDDGGKPFQTAPLVHAKAAYGYDGNQWRVCPGGPAVDCPLHQ